MLTSSYDDHNANFICRLSVPMPRNLNSDAFLSDTKKSRKYFQELSVMIFGSDAKAMPLYPFASCSTLSLFAQRGGKKVEITNDEASSRLQFSLIRRVDREAS